MTLSLYSAEAVDTALALIGEDYLATTEPGLYRQILKAVCGGDSSAVLAAIDATTLGDQEVSLLKQILVAYGQ